MPQVISSVPQPNLVCALNWLSWGLPELEKMRNVADLYYQFCPLVFQKRTSIWENELIVFAGGRRRLGSPLEETTGIVPNPGNTDE